MKKILLSLFVLAVIGFTAKVQAQCNISLNNVNVQPVSSFPLPDAAHCTVTFNVSFDLTYNSGAKFVYFNSYLATDYANLAITNPLDFDCTADTAHTPARNAPDAGRLGTTITQLGKSFLDVGLDLSGGHGAVGVPVPTTVLTTYEQDATVALNTPANSGGFTVTRTALASPANTDHFVVQNLQITFNTPCGGPLNVKTDVWASNANSKSAKAQCYICGAGQAFNDPTITGFKTCDRPARKYTMGVQTGEPGVTTLTWRVYIDNGANPGVLDDAHDDGIQDPGDDLMVLTGTQNPFNAANPYTSGAPAVYPHSSDPLYADIPLIYYAKVSGGGNAITKFIPNAQGCIPLPVGFKSFTATRNHSNVLLKWETSFEQNSNGFAIERNIRGTWEQVAFVPSQAAGGNSTSALAYLYVDLNNINGISQYRIKQVDFDAKFKLSDIRAVRGEGQAGHTIVFPNPSFDGRVSVVFEDANVTRDASLSDMSGRILKQWKGVTNNNIQIDNLTPGMYSLKIVVPETGEQSVQKIIVSKR